MDVVMLEDEPARQRRPRNFLPRQCFNHEPDFVQRFRLSWQTYEELERPIGPQLARATKRNNALEPRQQVLTALRFYATNSFYHVLRDAHGPSEASVCGILRTVTRVINDTLFSEVVRWPTENVERLAVDFFQLGGMPATCGVLDGTLINIKAPTHNEAQFVDRKGSHSLNTMVVCGPNHQLF